MKNVIAESKVMCLGVLFITKTQKYSVYNDTKQKSSRSQRSLSEGWCQEDCRVCGRKTCWTSGQREVLIKEL